MDFPRVGDRNPREDADRTANRAEEARQRKARLEEEAKKAAENKASDPQGIRERAGEASKRYEASWERVRSSYQRMVADFDQMQTLSDHGDFNHIRSLHAFLTELRRLGEAVVDDEVAFRKAFDEFQRDSGQAVGHFEKASDYFHRLAEAAEFPETKSLYRTASTWYATRSCLAIHQSL